MALRVLSRVLGLTTVVVALAVAAGCGGDEPSRAGVVPTATVTATPAPATTPRAPTPTGTVGVMSPLAYREETGRIEVRLAQPLSRIGRLVEGLPSEGTPSAFWQTQFQANVTELRALSEEMRRLMPPSCFVPVHQQVVAAATAFETAATRTDAWLSTGDAQGLVDALQQVNEGGRLYREARTRLPMIRC